jgi:hypothetical protein
MLMLRRSNDVAFFAAKIDCGCQATDPSSENGYIFQRLG